MDHLLLPLDPPHVAAVDRLAEGISAAAGLRPRRAGSGPHVTVLSFDGLDHGAAAELIAPIAAATPPFTVHAHGYGFFTGARPRDLSIHVPVARSTALDQLHGRLHHALESAGARVDGAGRPVTWLPHVTVVDDGLDPCTLALAVRWLAGRGHARWHLPVDQLVLTGARRDGGTCHARFPLAPGADR